MNKTLSVIIPIWKEKKILEELILAVRELIPLEIIVIRNDGNEELKGMEKLGCKIVGNNHHHKKNAACMLGAKAARGEVLLFLDGDVHVSSGILSNFIQPILKGEADIVLSNLETLLQHGHPLSTYMVWSQVFNEILDRRDWNIDTLQSFPHALSAEVINGIGSKTLANPILSQMKIVEQGWKITRINVAEWMPKEKIRSFFEKEQMDFSDYLEALTEWLEKKGERGGLTTGGKRLDLLEQLIKNKHFPSYKKGWGVRSSIYKGKQLSIIIPAQNEESTIKEVISEARELEPIEIIVVVNGSEDQTTAIASNLGATVIEFPDRLGHNVGRAIGALEASGDILLFIDADFAIPAGDLSPFPKSVADGIDLALNDLNGYLPIQHPLHNVSAFKYALNLMLNKKDLGIGSMLAVPHAISKSCLQSVGIEALVCPSLAQSKAVLHGFNVSCVYPVDVMKPNRMRPEQHLGSYTDGGSREAIMKKLKNDPKFPYYKEKLKKVMPIFRGVGYPSSLYNGKQLSVIIPAQNDEKTIEKVIREARKIEPLEIIVVVSGSKDETEKVAKKVGATVIVCKESLELETARAIGALASSGDIINFVDAALKGQTHAEMRIMGDHLEAISFLIKQIRKMLNSQ